MADIYQVETDIALPIRYLVKATNPHDAMNNQSLPFIGQPVDGLQVSELRVSPIQGTVDRWHVDVSYMERDDG